MGYVSQASLEASGIKRLIWRPYLNPKTRSVEAEIETPGRLAGRPSRPDERPEESQSLAFAAWKTQKSHSATLNVLP
jgi:hypothetical protein